MRISVVEDHVLISQSLSTVLRLTGHQVDVPELVSIDALAKTFEAFLPQVVLLDLDLGPVGRATPLIRPASEVGARVVIMSGTSNEWDIGEALSLGAAGWVPKNSPLDELVDVVIRATSGEALMDGRERDRLTGVWRRHQEAQRDVLRSLARLSPKEAEVLTGLMAGQSVTRLAASTFVSAGTVRTHVRGILMKLGVNSQLEAVALATRVGWKAPTGIGS